MMPTACSTPMTRLRYQSSAAQPKSISPLTMGGSRAACGSRQAVRNLLQPSSRRMAISRISKPLSTSAELKSSTLPASIASTLGR